MSIEDHLISLDFCGHELSVLLSALRFPEHLPYSTQTSPSLGSLGKGWTGVRGCLFLRFEPQFIVAGISRVWKGKPFVIIGWALSTLGTVQYCTYT